MLLGSRMRSLSSRYRYRPPSLCLYRRLITDCSNCCLLLLQTGRNSGPGLSRGRSEVLPPPDIAFTTPLHLTPALSGIGVNLLKHFPHVTLVQVLFKPGDFSFVLHLLAVWKQGRRDRGALGWIVAHSALKVLLHTARARQNKEPGKVKT